MNIRNLLSGILLVIPCTAWADPGDLPAKTSGPYFGIGAGYSKIDTRADAISVGGEDFSYRLLGGYRFAELPLPLGLDVGVEVAYADLGKVDEDTLGANVEIELTGIVTTGVIYLPVSRHFDVMGKAGVYFWDGQVRTDNVKTSDESSTDLTIGLGFAMQTGTAFGAQFEIESLDALDGVWTATLSATYQFK